MNSSNQKSIAIERLLKNEPLKTVIDPKGEYQVCTSIAAWRSCCRVYRAGLEVDEFPPIFLNLNAKIRTHGKVTKELRTRIAREIAQTHFAKCREVKEYIDSQALRSKRRSKVMMVAVLAVCLPLLLVLMLIQASDRDRFFSLFSFYFVKVWLSILKSL